VSKWLACSPAAAKLLMRPPFVGHMVAAWAWGVFCPVLEQAWALVLAAAQQLAAPWALSVAVWALAAAEVLAATVVVEQVVVEQAVVEQAVVEQVLHQ